MVIVLAAFYSDDPSSNPADVYNFSVKLLLKRTKTNKKEAGVGHFFKTKCTIFGQHTVDLIQAKCHSVKLGAWIKMQIEIKW